jgi:hypothetical protein
MRNAVFWNVTPYGTCKNRCFGERYLVHHQGECEVGTTLAITRNWSTLRRGDTFLHNVGSNKSHTASHPRSRHSQLYFYLSSRPAYREYWLGFFMVFFSLSLRITVCYIRRSCCHFPTRASWPKYVLTLRDVIHFVFIRQSVRNDFRGIHGSSGCVLPAVALGRHSKTQIEIKLKSWCNENGNFMLCHLPCIGILLKRESNRRDEQMTSASSSFMQLLTLHSEAWMRPSLLRRCSAPPIM